MYTTDKSQVTPDLDKLNHYSMKQILNSFDPFKIILKKSTRIVQSIA